MTKHNLNQLKIQILPSDIMSNSRRSSVVTTAITNVRKKYNIYYLTVLLPKIRAIKRSVRPPNHKNLIKTDEPLVSSTVYCRCEL